MPNLMSRGATCLGSKAKVAAGRTVTYRRGTDTVSLVLPAQKHMEEVIDSEGVGTWVRDYAWTLVASELILAGTLERPREGDFIEETLAGEAIKWEVLPPVENLPCWNWFDQNRILITVHSKQVE